MAGGKLVYINFTILVLLACASLTLAGLWTVNIDNGPAPPPELGPPFSSHAIRDPAYLPYQILGIVGSYFIVILFIGTLLLSHGQRARRRAQMLASEHRGEEMVRPAKAYWDLSPISPQSRNQWYSRGTPKIKQSASVSVQSLNSAKSPGNDSVASFNASVIELDKQKRAQEMEKLYAAVMEQEEQRAHLTPVRSHERGSPERYGAPHFTNAPGLRHLQQDTTPRSPVKAIYPPDAALVQRTPHTSSGSYNSTTSPARSSGGSVRSPDTSPKKTKKRQSLKNLKISSPIRIADNDDGARTPLSPRIYFDPGTPPEPPTARTVDTYDDAAWPQTPGTARSTGPAYDEDYPYHEHEDTLPDLPATYHQRGGKRKQNFSQPLKVEVPKQITVSAPSASASSASNQLPFRQLHWNSPESPMYPYKGQGPFSAGPTKTTFVEVNRDRLGVAPLTGLKTPYSAYMPFTPLTPVTPHLTTRAERKQREREQRSIKGAITEEDQVRDDKDLWDSGY